jgi:hypothetical protein
MVEETRRDKPFRALRDLSVTAAWRRLCDALNNLRASARYELTDEEAEKADKLIDLARRIA